MRQLDRTCARGVSNIVGKYAAILSVILLVGPACSKDEPEEPKKPSDGTVTSEGVKDKDPDTSGLGSVSAGGNKGEPAPTDTGNPATPPKDDTTASPGIKPPDLDLPTNVQAERVKAHIQNAINGIRANDPDKTLREARSALSIDPNSIDAVALMAHAYYLKKRYETAEVALDLVLKEKGELARSNPRLFYTFGVLYAKTERGAKARVAFESALKLNPNHEGALTNLGVFQLRNKQYKAAQGTYEKLTQSLRVNNAVVHTNLGSAYRGQAAEFAGTERDTLLRKAEAAYKKALTINRSYANAYYNLGLLFLDAKPYPGLTDVKRLERAKAYLDEYRNKPGSDQEVVRGQLKLAKKLLKRAIKKEKRAKEKAEKAAKKDNEE